MGISKFAPRGESATGTIDVQPGELAGFHQPLDGSVDEFLELGIVLANHAAVGLDLKRLADDFERCRVLRVGAQSEQENVVQRQGRRPAALHQLE